MPLFQTCIQHRSDIERTKHTPYFPSWATYGVSIVGISENNQPYSNRIVLFSFPLHQTAAQIKWKTNSPGRIGAIPDS